MTTIITVLYGIGGALLIALSFNSSMKAEEENTLNNYRFVCSTLMMANSISKQTDAFDIAAILRELNDEEVEWYAVRLYEAPEDSDIKLLYSSKKSFAFDDSLYLVCSNTEAIVKNMKIDNEHYMQVTGCFEVGDETIYLDLIRSVSTPFEIRSNQIKYYRILYVLVVLIGIVISVFVAIILTRNMRYLSKVSRKIASGNYGIRANIKSKDEMKILADDFNTMAESLTGKISELEDSVERQERFVGSFAHEMKTPMTSMIGYADLLRSLDMSKDEQRECAEYIFNEAKRLESLSLKLLDLLVLKKQDFELREVSPANILRETAVLMNEKLGQSNVMLRFSTKKGKCLLEPDLVKSLLANLIDNAVKAIDEGGEVVVNQSMIKDGCRFEISDNGRGIPKEEIEHIHEAFYRVDKSRSRKQGGAGLGLALCSEIVNLHNGTIEYYSEVNKGTKVIVELKGKNNEANE